MPASSILLLETDPVAGAGIETILAGAGYAVTPVTSADEAIGQSLDLIIPERLRSGHWRGFDAAMASGATRLHGHPTITRADHKSGARLYVEMSFALVRDGAGTVIGSVALARDASERVETRNAPSGQP